MGFFKYLDYQVYYERHGQGKVILLLNGIMMSTKSWAPFIESLSERNTLLLVDFFDQGQTDKNPGGYLIEDQAKLINALLEHLKINEVSLTGISYGSEVALKFTTLYPQKVSRLAVFNATAFTTKHLYDALHEWKTKALEDDPQGLYDVAIKDIYSANFIKKAADWMESRQDFLVNEIFASQVFKSSLIRLIDSTKDFEEQKSIALINCPTLIIGAEMDALMPLGNQYHLTSLIKNSSMVIVPRVGHALMYEAPMVFTSIILGFVNCRDHQFPI